jgi:hypothetical protein
MYRGTYGGNVRLCLDARISRGGRGEQVSTEMMRPSNLGKTADEGVGGTLIAMDFTSPTAILRIGTEPIASSLILILFGFVAS